MTGDGMKFMVSKKHWLLGRSSVDANLGEAQPIYDEFGAVFLLILVSRARLGLRKSDIGIRRKDGFLAEYLEREHSEYALSELSEEKDSKLGEWINALYLADGLSDELFANCSPHDYYLLIPTLLRQSVTAHQLGKLSLESLTAGLDCKIAHWVSWSISNCFQTSLSLFCCRH